MVARHMRAGGLVAMPTETVYGFGALLRPGLISRVQQLKARDHDSPFLVLVAGPESVPELEWTPWAREFAKLFWPGSLTLVLPDPQGRFPLGVRSAAGTVAIRQSPHPLARGLVEALGEPILSTSVNPPKGIPALTAQEAMETAVSLGGGTDLWVLDSGPLPPSEPSTIIDCSGPQPLVVRAGSIPLNRLRCVFPELENPDP
jgi:L-threonylcarbamoyladenylate synthase